MNEVLLQLITQWGTAGIFILAGGYLIWDNWKKNKKAEEWFRDKMTATESRANMSADLNVIKDKLDYFAVSHETFKNEMHERIGAIEAKVNDMHNTPSDLHALEVRRVNAITKLAPSMHSMLNEGLANCDVDHIAVALLHNGTTSIAGVPYIKFGVIAEKFKPIRHPEDINLIQMYKEEDIMSHNRLPECIMHNQEIEFEIADDCSLLSIDPKIYNKCRQRGIKRIAFRAIRDVKNLCTGFVFAYKFDESPIDMHAFKGTAHTIEDLYRGLLANLDV